MLEEELAKFRAAQKKARLLRKLMPIPIVASFAVFGSMIWWDSKFLLEQPVLNAVSVVLVMLIAVLISAFIGSASEHKVLPEGAERDLRLLYTFRSRWEVYLQQPTMNLVHDLVLLLKSVGGDELVRASEDLVALSQQELHEINPGELQRAVERFSSTAERRNKYFSALSNENFNIADLLPELQYIEAVGESLITVPRSTPSYFRRLAIKEFGLRSVSARQRAIEEKAGEHQMLALRELKALGI